jgi:type I phosphodiesterase/nucleotide pyrophosphatase
MKKINTCILLLSFIAMLVGITSCKQDKQDYRVIVLGLDGLMPDAIERAKTPHLHHLIMDGTSTMKARSVYPTSSGANWSSMLLGCGPDQHGIDINGWTLENRKTTPVYEKDNGFSTSIFDLIKEKYPDRRTSAVLNWFTITNYFDASVPDTLIDVVTTREAIDQILNEIIEHNSMFVFSQIDHMDHAGHSMGFGSEEYNLELENLDIEIGRLIKSLKENNLYENTYIITLSDHGGNGYGHGNKTMQEYTIPFIIVGPGIVKGKSSSETVYTFDVAAIIASIFNCEVPDYWIGSNMKSAFGLKDEFLSDFIPKAIILEDSVSDEYSFLQCKVTNGNEEIKYKIPAHSDQWHDYHHQIKLPLGDTIFASVFSNNKPTRISSYAKPYLSHVGIKSNLEIDPPADSKYSGKGAKSLIDGLISDNEAFNNKEWLGFQGNDLNCIIKLDEKQIVNSVTFRFLENVKSWIFLPKSIRIFSFENGKSFTENSYVKNQFDIDNENIVIKELKVELQPVETQFIKIIVENYGILPEWHSGAGENAWLFTDEIIIE